MSDSKHSKGGVHLTDAHLPNVDELKSPRPRQAGSMLMASARIEVDANCRPGDPLTPVLRKHAATYAERVRTEAPEYMQQVGAGDELVPASMLGENSRALQYRSTVDRPDCVAIEASRDRLELADKAGALEMGLDLADTIEADNSMEKMLVHQMAAAHNSAMRMTALVNRRLESLESMADINQLYINRLTMQNIERLNIETCRLAGTAARMMNTFQQGMLTLQRVRTGGEQRVVVEQHQYVTRVEDGGTGGTSHCKSNSHYAETKTELGLSDEGAPDRRRGRSADRCRQGQSLGSQGRHHDPCRLPPRSTVVRACRPALGSNRFCPRRPARTQGQEGHACHPPHCRR